MKKRLSIILSLVVCLAMITTLFACGGGGEGDGGGGGSTTPTPSTSEMEGKTASEVATVINGFGSSTDTATITSNINKLLGVDITLPSGTMSASVVTEEGYTAYVVAITTEESLEDHADALISKFTADGWTTVEDAFVKYSSDRTTMYACTFEEDDGQIFVYCGSVTVNSSLFVDGVATTASNIKTNVDRMLQGDFTMPSIASNFYAVPIEDESGRYVYEFSFEVPDGTTFDTVANAFTSQFVGYTKGATETDYGMTETKWEKVLNEDDYYTEKNTIYLSEYMGYYTVDFYIQMGNLSAWPTAEVADIVGASKVPAFESTAEDVVFSNVSDSGEMLGMYYIEIEGATSAEYDTYLTALTTAAYTYDEDEGKYAKVFTDGTKIEIEPYEDTYEEGRFVIYIYFYDNDGELTAWPSAKFASSFSDFTVPSIVGATSYTITDDYSYGGYGYITLNIYGLTEAELNTYFETTLTAAGAAYDGEDDADFVNASAEKQLNVSLYSYDADTDCATLIFTSSQYEAPEFLKLPENFKMAYNDDGDDCVLYCVDGSYYVTTPYRDVYIKKNTNGSWTHYELEPEYLSWRNKGNYSLATLNDVLYEYYMLVFDFRDEDDSNLASATVETVTMCGMEATKYTWSKTQYYEYNYTYVVTNDGKYVLQDDYTYGSYSTTYGHVVSEFVVGGVVLPAPRIAFDAPVAWPTALLTEAIGEDLITHYSGDVEYYIYEDETVYSVLDIEIYINGVNEAGIEDYYDALVADGFELRVTSSSSNTYWKFTTAKDAIVAVKLTPYIDSNQLYVEISTTAFEGAEWPAEDLEEMLLVTLPVFEDKFADYVFYSMGTTTGYLSISNTTAANSDAYKQALLDAGFTAVSNSKFTKVIGDETVTIDGYAYQSSGGLVSMYLSRTTN